MLHKLMGLPTLWVGFGHIGLALLLLAAACLAPREGRQRLIYRIFLSVSALALFVCRLPMLFYDRPINPDEALMAANAMRAWFGWLNWDIVDPLTAGPLDSMVLAWPRLFGLDITFLNVRLTGLLLLAGAIGLLAEAVRRLFDERIAMAAVLPVCVFLILTNYYDFVNYTSEILPIILISLGIFGLAAYRRSGRTGFLLIAAFVAGCVPFAKLQGTPIAALVGLIALACAIRQLGPGRRWGLTLGVIVAGCLPAAIFLVPLAVSGGFDDFVKSYFLQQRLRLANEGWRDAIAPMLASSPFGRLALGYGAVLVLGSALAAWIYRRTGRAPDRATIALLLLVLALAGVSYAAAAGSGRAFPHYLLLGVPALILTGAAGTALAAWGAAVGRRGATTTLLGLTAVSLAILLPALAQERRFNQKWSAQWVFGIYLHGQAFKAPHTLQWLRPEPGDRMICWGWRSQCYVDAAMAPATREATNENQVYDTALRGYFRDRFMRDLRQDPPAYIVDAVAPGSFVFEDPSRYGIAGFPDFEAVLRSDYVPISKVADPAACPRVYARADRAAALARSQIAFATIAAGSAEPGFGPEAVDDGSVFESCADYWLPREGRPGSLQIAFAAPSPVKRILLLNTRDGDRAARSSQVARLALMSQGREVWSSFVQLEPFPRWTEVKLPDPAPTADAFHIDVLAYWGFGGGLNEVKLYRD